MFFFNRVRVKQNYGMLLLADAPTSKFRQAAVDILSIDKNSHRTHCHNLSVPRFMPLSQLNHIDNRFTSRFYTEEIHEMMGREMHVIIQR